MQGSVKSSETIWGMAVFTVEVTCYPILPSQISMAVKFNDTDCTQARN